MLIVCFFYFAVLCYIKRQVTSYLHLFWKPHDVPAWAVFDTTVAVRCAQCDCAAYVFSKFKM